MTLPYATPTTPTPSPWRWVPALYAMQVVPYVLINETVPVLLKDRGYANATITLWVGVVSMAWTLKLLWSPLVESHGRRRSWVVACQSAILVTIGLAAAGTLGAGLPWVIAALALMALLSATHDIAADGLYLATLPRDRQAALAGVQTGSSRLGRLAMLAGVPMVAGLLEHRTGGAWPIALCVLGVLYGVGAIINLRALPESPAPPADRPFAPDAGRAVACVAAGAAVFVAVSHLIRLAGHALGTRFGGPAAQWVMTTPWPSAVWAGVGIAAAAVTIPLAVRVNRGTPLATAFGEFRRRSGFWGLLAFLAFYRVGEVMVGKMASLFLREPRESGGMGLDLVRLGQVTGVAGMAGIILGGLAGGALVARFGLRRAIWPLALAMHAPNALYWWTAAHQPAAWVAYPVQFVDQFGYGLGFSAFAVVVMRYAQRGGHATSHYAIGMGLAALSINIVGMFCGVLQQAVGYSAFFAITCAVAIPGLVTLWFVPLDDE